MPTAAVELFLDLRKLEPGQNLGNAVSLQPIAGFEAALDRLGEQRRAVLVDPGVTSHGVLERLEAAGARVIEGDEPCILAKACKNPVELAGARDAQRRDGAAVCRFLCWLEGELLRRAGRPSSRPPPGSRPSAARTRCSAARASRPSRPPARTPRCRTTG